MSEQYTICQIEIGENKFDIDSKYWNNQTSLKTINGESLFGDGDINITLGDDNENFVRSTINIDYASLLELIEENRLVPGQQYRITDYITTTIQENTKSAGHQFDIIVTADSENTLNEIARVCLHDGDTYFSDSGANLEAWQIWYCIDNDTERFAWADSENGKGVIYRMIDEWCNDLPYDFKNIQFKRHILNQNDAVATNVAKDGDLELVKDKLQEMCYRIHTSLWYYGSYISDIYPNAEPEAKYVPFGDIYYENNEPSVLCKIAEGTFEYFYTFHNDGDASLSKPNKEENVGVWDNVIKNSNNAMYVTEEGRFEQCTYNNQYLNDIVFYGDTCYSNTFGNNCDYNTFGNNCDYNTFGNHCDYNTFGNNCYSNTFGNDCYSNTFGNHCDSNTFGNYCYSNTFGNYCYSNTFGNYCDSNTFGNDCDSNTFGNDYDYNTFGNNCYSNTFGNNCDSNTFGNNCDSNTFGNNCDYNNFGSSKSSPSSYYRYIIFDNGNSYINLHCTSTTSSSNYYQNVRIGLGVNKDNYKTISDANVNQTYETLYIPEDSQTITI